ncbi:uncharacterized protein LOC106062016 isoform X2 [Biomphalaria glabrata]|uniref:Uncharacterized protein LOC106062016 isoform X2 n=1 Tax=Biomphalaria glabrata TaxID=6526 RepID=A0A9W2YUW5_BIOGL|nr:uncharacterized protein LOC106062016 isoform X2 [Biomphalaria glabrata]
MLLSSIAFVYIQIGLTLAFSDCGPAEEGKQYQLSYRWTATSNATKLTVRRNGHMIGGCDTGHCSSYYIRFNISIGKATEQEFVIHVTIENITREDASNWTISYIGNHDSKHLSYCYLPTFFRPNNVTCHTVEDMIGLKIKCTTVKVYPAAKCLFLVYIKGKKIDHTNKIVYEHTPMKSTELPDGQYFSSSCTCTLPQLHMEPGEYLINVTVAPVIIKSGEEEKYGLTSPTNFYIDSSEVKLENCPKIVELNTTITCSCVIVGKRKTSNAIRWYSQDGRLLHNGSSITLTGSQSLTEYKCEGDIYLTSKNPSVLYSPVVLDTKKNINCSIEETNENLQVICSTHEICSRVACIFNVTYSRTDTGLEKSSYVTFNLEEHCNCCTCTLYLKRSHFDSAGVYNIKITFSLNTSDISQHIVYEANSFLQFLKVDDSHRRDKTSARFFQIVSISSVAAVLYLMMSSALIYIAVLKKRKKQKKIVSRKSVKNVKTYENRLSIQSDHNYECIQPEDHYDRCVDLVQDDEDRQQDQPMQDIVDTEYITPIETEHMT